MTLRNAVVFASLSSLLFFGCPATSVRLEDGPKRIHTEGTFVHETSGMRFPERIGPWVRERILQYDSEGHNVSVGYNIFRWGPGIAATVYVYPGPPTVKVFPIPSLGGPCRGLVGWHFGAVKKEIEDTYPDAVLIAEGEVAAPQAVAKDAGRRALYRYTLPTPYGRQMFLSEAYLFGHKRHFIKYRATYLEMHAERGSQDVKDFMRALAWP